LNSIPGGNSSSSFFDLSFNDVAYEALANLSHELLRHTPQSHEKCGLNLMKAGTQKRVASVSEYLSQSLPSKSVLFLGCSLDANALIAFCASVGSKLHGNPYEGQFCKVGNLTTAFLFHPGSGEPPYFSLYDKALDGKHMKHHPSTHDIITKHAPIFTQSIMGAQPDLVVVDDSLWSLSKWWEHNGGDISMTNQSSFPIPSKELQQWCNGGLKSHMGLVAATYPSSRVAFRTAPTVTKPFYGQTAEIIDIMQECIAAQTNGDRLFGKYSVIHFHDMVDRMMQSSKEKGQPVEDLYCDGIHPGPEISLAYANMVLDLVRI